MTLSYPPDETLAACGRCGWTGTEEDLRHPDEYENESPSSYKGRNDELEGGREFCCCCDESAQVWSKSDWEYALAGGEVEQTWEEFVQEMRGS
jgi:hypothetical protein